MLTTEYFVTIQPSGHIISVQQNETILDAALRLGYRFPHLCRSANCGTCTAKLISGEVDYTTNELPALSKTSPETNMILSCQAMLKSDCTIYIEDVIAPHELPEQLAEYTVTQLNALTDEITQVFLQPIDTVFSFLAGQYLELVLKNNSRYPFSIACAPNDEGMIELHIRHNADNAFAINIIKELSEEKKVVLKGPYGRCILHTTKPNPIIFLSGGTGLAPAKAILEQALSLGLKRELHLYWGAKHPDEFYLNDLLEKWHHNLPHFTYHPVLSAPISEGSWTGYTGWVHEAVCNDFADLSQYEVYASGPPKMVYAAQQAFLNKGLPKQHLYSDVFDFES